MFKTDQSASYTWPVAVDMPGDGGKRATHKFDAQFKRLSQSEIESLMRRVNSGETGDGALLAEVLLGWKGVQDEDGAELPFSEGNREKLLNVYPVRPAVVAAFFDSIRTGREKN